MIKMPSTLFRALALMPILERDAGSKGFQRRSNIAFLSCTLAFMAISLAGQWNDIASHSIDSPHTLPRILDNIATGELFFLEPIGYMWVIALGLLLLQRWDLFQQPIMRKRGRPMGPRVKAGENPWKDDAYRIALEEVLIVYGKGLGSSIGGIILHKLIKMRAFAKRYNQESLAAWMYNSYREYFDEFDPKSMTTPSYVDKNIQQVISKLFESFIKV